ncbi:hypothetical protein C2845_PM12G16820 [Panicum miliaceum]|uniref:Uncharacterized protein n=1 Tax=Panicum miliaceum TaxID=4540 RepID=A0A3L6QJ24_PANMI|nr:hypothetical protein C2845_PM12G16820 [Panicum miliaceum]
MALGNSGRQRSQGLRCRWWSLWGDSGGVGRGEGGGGPISGPQLEERQEDAVRETDPITTLGPVDPIRKENEIPCPMFMKPISKPVLPTPKPIMGLQAHLEDEKDKSAAGVSEDEQATVLLPGVRGGGVLGVVVLGGGMAIGWAVQDLYHVCFKGLEVVRGLNNTARKVVRDLVTDTGCSIVCPQETKMVVIDAQVVQETLGGEV